MKNGISEEIWQKINTVFSAFPEIETAILYGSRAKGNYKNGSDIDIVFKGNKLNGKIINNVSISLDKLMLPYSFDLSIFHQIENQELIEHVNRKGVVIFGTK
jgi:predicted nucleotidyltransferase